MNDTPGWASPGSAPSDGQQPGASGSPEPADRPTPTQPADQPTAPAQPADQPPAPGAQWSQQQPPPGQWSAPTGQGRTPPPPPPGPGWGTPPPGAPGSWGGPAGPGGYGGHPGAPGGWGTPWGGPPPAAKPGVIPLRPLGVGEILDGAVSTMRTYWRTVLGISLTIAVLTEIVVILLQGFVLNDTASTDSLSDPDASLEEVTRAMGESLLGLALLSLVTLIATVAVTALLTAVTSRAVLGKPVTAKEAWRDARPQVLKLLGLLLLLPLIATGIFAVGLLPGALAGLAGSPPAAVTLVFLGLAGAFVLVLWLMIRFSLASPALMLEKQSIRKAMSRSVKLVRGSWWRIFGIQLLAVIIANVVAMVIAVPFAVVALLVSDDGVSNLLTGNAEFGWTYLIISGIGSVIGSMITYPISAGVTVLLYIDQRIRREALDLDLARAAGVQGHGAPTGS
ncbi:glycerophosphoryl diester phosphodiesterase membrane domain-containing protein [Streptomyces sp. NPDC096205]|uniref:glycerophosphoryl diester phosphodiesterase membrane domain-containing protein n=1 Tax=Streptomyces sp. NPDC096205 TaxID=3366081 RepID=UPI0037F51E23